MFLGMQLNSLDTLLQQTHGTHDVKFLSEKIKEEAKPCC